MGTNAYLDLIELEEDFRGRPFQINDAESENRIKVLEAAHPGVNLREAIKIYTDLVRLRLLKEVYVKQQNAPTRTVLRSGGEMNASARVIAPAHGMRCVASSR